MNVRSILARIKNASLKFILPKKHTSDKITIDEASFRKKISKADVVSFDIFDTLISREIYTPEDLFEIIGRHFGIKDFKDKRIQADNVSRTLLNRDVNINDIYDTLHKKYKIKNTDKIKEFEKNLELNLCIPRNDILRIFNELIKKGTPVILVSDMYLEEKTIKAMLKKCGYQGYDKLYLSNTINKRKDTKTIWKDVKQDFKGKRIIHIGDNQLSDYTYPKEFGISTIQVYSSKSLAEKSTLPQYIQDDLSNCYNSLFWGRIINGYLFNSPFVDSSQLDSLESLGNIFYGPILELFTSFIIEHTNKKDKLLFLAREGYNLQKIYQEYCKLYHLPQCENYYFLASRKAVINTNFTSLKSIEEFAKNNYYHGSMKNWFKQILDTTIETEDFEITLPNDFDKIQFQLKTVAPDIIQHSKKAKANYGSYINKSIGNLSYNTKIIDLGYSGTIQYELSKMQKKPLCGIYLASSDSVKRYSSNSKLLFLFDTKENPDYKKIYEYSLILEFYLSAPYGQLIAFNKKNDKVLPVYNNEVLSKRKANAINQIHKGIKQHLKDSVNLKKNIPLYAVEKDAIFHLYTYCVEQNIISYSVKDEFDFTDNFTADRTRNVFKIINKY